jgi:hypothetical protein
LPDRHQTAGLIFQWFVGVFPDMAAWLRIVRRC